MKENFTLLRSTLEVTFTTQKITCEIWTEGNFFIPLVHYYYYYYYYYYYLQMNRFDYFHCYTVHVVELLNYYTNYCTFIKFTN